MDPLRRFVLNPVGGLQEFQAALVAQLDAGTGQLAAQEGVE